MVTTGNVSADMYNLFVSYRKQTFSDRPNQSTARHLEDDCIQQEDAVTSQVV